MASSKHSDMSGNGGQTSTVVTQANQSDPAAPGQDSLSSAEPSPQLSADELARRAAHSKRAAAVFGEIVHVLMRSDDCKHQMLADLEWLVVPAVRTRQFRIAHAQSKSQGYSAPVAAVLWASVSDDVDARLAADPSRIRLKPEEWKSGAIVWIVQASGDARVVGAILKDLLAKDWQGRTVKMWGRDGDGRPKVTWLERPVPAAQPHEEG